MNEAQVRAAVGAFEAGEGYWRMVLVLKEIDANGPEGATQATEWVAPGRYDVDYGAGMIVVNVTAAADGDPDVGGEKTFVPFDSISHVELLLR